MLTAQQKTAARRNVTKVAAGAKAEKAISHLSKGMRTALGKRGAKVAKDSRALA